MATNTVKRSDKARARVEAVRAAGERRFEDTRERTRWLPLLLESFEREQRSGAALLAGGLAYRLFFWLVSFGLLVAAAASFWERSDKGGLTHTAKSFGLSGIAARSAVSAVEEGAHSRWYLLVSGIVLITYFGVGAVRALRVTAFIAWQVKPARLHRPIRASAVFTALFVLGIGITMLASWERHHSAGLGLATAIAGIAGYAALALLAFHLLPRPEGTGWRDLLPGALLVGVGFAAVHVFVVYYLSDKLERSPKLYGVLGASTVVLLGLFLIARVAVAAMFFNATLRRRRISPDRGDESDALRADAVA